LIEAYVYGLIIFSFLIILTTVILIVRDNGKNSIILRALVLMFLTSVLACLGQIIAVTAKVDVIAIRGMAIYFVSIDWLLVVLVYYSRHYTQIWSDSHTLQISIGAIAAIDTINLLSNSSNRNSFDVMLVQINGGEEQCFSIIPFAFYNLHLLFCYGLVLLIVAIFVRKIIQSAGFHKMRYVTILALFLGIIAINAMYMAMEDIVLDFSIFLYIILGLAIAYFSLYYNPHVFVEYMLSQVTDKMECGMVCYDENDQAVYANRLACLIFDTTEHSYELTRRLEEWKRGMAVQEISDCEWNDVYHVNDKDRHYNIHFTKVYDKKGYYSGCYFSFYDVSADVDAYEEERFRATHDKLTGALNRDSFYEEAKKIIDENPDTEFLIICSDVKDFKIINDVFGLAVGDNILIKISDSIRAKLQDRAVYARMEADRFALLLPKERFAERKFIKAMDEISDIIDNALYKMHIHIGVYEVVDRSVSVAMMCDRAYMAIDSIKGSYKERIAYYGDVLRKVYMDEQKIVGEFERALEKGQFQIYLQPQVNTEGVAQGAECLVRWIHPVKGVIAPGQFIEVLERTGLVYKLDAYVWELACQKLANWKEKGYEDYSLSVNISPKDFYYIDVYKTLVDLVEQYNINPNQLNLEITETAFMNDIEKQLELVKNLQSYGFKIEMDDFGSGYSSLNMLKEMPVDILKIDMAFLAVTENEIRSRKIVNMVVSLAKVLDMTVISEGVETKEQVEYLTKAGCDMFQGYYFEKPIPVREFEEKYL